MSDDINFQTWICPKCFDDHRMDGPCKPVEFTTSDGSAKYRFMPAESDHSHIANEFRKLSQENQNLRECLKDISFEVQKIINAYQSVGYINNYQAISLPAIAFERLNNQLVKHRQTLEGVK